MKKIILIVIFLIFLALVGLFWYTSAKSFAKSEDQRSAKWDEYNKRFKK